MPALGADIFSCLTKATVLGDVGEVPVRHSESSHSWSLHGIVLDIVTTRRLTLTLTITVSLTVSCHCWKWLKMAGRHRRRKLKWPNYDAVRTENTGVPVNQSAALWRLIIKICAWCIQEGVLAIMPEPPPPPYTQQSAAAQQGGPNRLTLSFACVNLKLTIQILMFR